MKDRHDVGDALRSAQGTEVGGANELGALGKEVNTFVVAKEGVPPVEVEVELNSGEDFLKARDEARAVDTESQA